MLGGVCGGLGRYFDVDPILFRILFVALTIFSGGLFLLVWLVLLLVMPAEPTPAYAAAPPYAAPTSFAAGGAGQFTDPATGQTYGSPPPPPPVRTQPRSYLGVVALCAAVVVGGMLGLAAALGADIPAVVVLAGMLAVVAGGLIVGAWRGRARWLVAIAVPLLLVTGAAAAVQHGFTGGIGQRTWIPTASATTTNYELGTGEATLDLRRLSGAGGSITLQARVGAGRLQVLVPADVRLVLDGSVGLGELSAPGLPSNSDDITPEARTTVEPLGSPTTVTTVNLNAEVGVGDLEVRRAAS
jgi:phage shock protein PspC (stress-responsive transcriptional regulator)